MHILAFTLNVLNRLSFFLVFFPPLFSLHFVFLFRFFLGEPNCVDRDCRPHPSLQIDSDKAGEWKWGKRGGRAERRKDGKNSISPRPHSLLPKKKKERRTCPNANVGEWEEEEINNNTCKSDDVVDLFFLASDLGSCKKKKGKKKFGKIFRQLLSTPVFFAPLNSCDFCPHLCAKLGTH